MAYLMNDLDKQRSKKKVDHELREANWELRAFESQKDLEIMLYFYDHFDSGELILAGLRKQDLAALSAVSHTMEDIKNSIEAAFRSYVGEASKKAKTSWTEVIGGMLGLYMLKTKTYSKLKTITPAEEEMRHFLIIRYKSEHSDISSLRPFSIISKSSVLSPEEVKAQAIEVIKQDERTNAGYFNFNKVVKLRE